MGRNHIGNLNQAQGRRDRVRVRSRCQPPGPTPRRWSSPAPASKPKQVGDLREMLEVNSVDAGVHRHAGSLARTRRPSSPQRPANMSTWRSRARTNVREGRADDRGGAAQQACHAGGHPVAQHPARACGRWSCLRNGAIGRVLVAKAWNSQKRSSIGKAKPSSAAGTSRL